MSVKAVAFDIDGTLYPNRSMYFHSIPFYLSHFRLISAFSKIRKDIRKITPVDDFPALQAELFAKELSIEPEEAGQIIEKVFFSDWELIFKRVRIFPGARELLLSLQERGIKTAALSDFPVGNKLNYFNLADCWDVIMSSDESGYLKPSREPFLELAKRLDVKPEEVLYVGNNSAYDVGGSRAAGMMSAHVKPFWKKGNPQADCRFSRYSQLSEFIDGLLRGE
ncbi:MAG: HAD family hydrolase [Spirochaetales bacterium]|nr:HAD family hydrolase [Spirochaetales bacterium]